MTTPRTHLRRWRGLDLGTWLVSSAMFASLVWCEFYTCRTAGGLGGPRLCYGWPFLAVVNLEMTPAKPPRWRVWAAGRAADAVAVMLMIVSTAIVVQRWRRRNPGWPQFRLSRLMLLVAAVGVTLSLAVHDPPPDANYKAPDMMRGLHYVVRLGDQPIYVRACIYVGAACSAWLVLPLFVAVLRGLRSLAVELQLFSAGPLAGLRRGQFNLRSVAVVLTALAVWLGTVVNRAHQQRLAVKTIETLGGAVRYDWEHNWMPFDQPQPPGPVWLRQMIGDDFFQDVEIVSLAALSSPQEPALRELIPHLRRLRRLKRVFVKFSAPQGIRDKLAAAIPESNVQLIID